MEDLTRLIISHERIENIKNNNLELSKEESHYVNKVMRIKNGKEIFIANGEGSLWKAIKVKNDCLKISKLKKPYLFQEKEIYLLGIAVVIPKSGFEDILKMCTEIGIDFIQPLFSERQVNKNLNFTRKLLRWNSIIKEAVEQSERLWQPSILRDTFPCKVNQLIADKSPVRIVSSGCSMCLSCICLSDNSLL